VAAFLATVFLATAFLATAFRAPLRAAFFGAAFRAPLRAVFFGAAFLALFFTADLRAAFFATTLRAPFLAADFRVAFLAVVFFAVFRAAALVADFLAAALAIVMRPSRSLPHALSLARRESILESNFVFAQSKGRRCDSTAVAERSIELSRAAEPSRASREASAHCDRARAPSSCELWRRDVETTARDVERQKKSP
jgi:hypothetical protein